VIKRRYPPEFVATVGVATAKELARLRVDPDVKLPADVQAAVARGEAEFQRFKRRFKRLKKRQWIGNAGPKGNAPAPSFITSVVDQEGQNRRDVALDARAQQSQGKRRQPPMLERLRVVQIIVDRLRAEGVRFATGRNSQMNKLVREWLNGRAARTPDGRKSRRKRVTADTVRRLLRQIKALGD
jgi:hypothetical protein